ncbi:MULTISPECIES: ligase-associated DNA damage response DEXH box helicase [Bradyrhizobium]|uniref:Large ATP-dependent helicase-related protein n=1 Tax=Bradyrhizobium diazoefficiens (strain JCM 10833 / BCRC 13528 / IAM 13628 / NBRC 14792 / USDA 110) TaxID=224911 RepID=Q89V99_BRADU|nr:ligase-associated DNA damage response DEXH box helicase [Bradyrhizobium diazoefficiens]MBP1060134.1 ATP-dependent Lhr-like helicase [Bradyrhizobium japonicum]AND86844.1 helicase [Bradyrhizobium diazoefficiens USDA 110]PDT62026.1 DNA ligase-associated DEXH box helicase [Bradyrhizobium diazoefficiens]QBP20087.1 ligase-associated DNA damage response DEXH box helicase [Bradyrhizobium diazoefficiens]QJS40808.1 ligase-associated DNA damage response DEXH box helicase [Bradyrhizobium diazoefficiens
MPPRIHKIPAEPAAPLPDRFEAWFAARGWSPRAHQLALLEKAREDRSALLIAPTGAGKTLAGFLPTLVELSSFSSPSPLVGEGRGGGWPQAPLVALPPSRQPAAADLPHKGGGDNNSLVSTGRSVQRSAGLHTLYISPLKALAVDIARNLERPIAEMALPIKVETRTGDTPVSRRQRQRRYPPDILLTTPEQLALLLSSDDAPFLFSSLKRIVLDELHALVTSKRGDLLSLGLARLWRLAPQIRAIGLSATVAEPDQLARFLVPQPGGNEVAADIVIAGGAAPPLVEMLDTRERLPWAGHGARHALSEVYELIKANKTTLVFVNTRSQAEMLFQDLWRMNDDGLAIALHHGSLDVAQRRKVEDAMSAGKLRAVVCTSSLDLGVDWGDVDLVVNIGAPKGSSRLMQRIGRANHRLDEASRAVLVPANRFEVLECRVAIDAIAENAQDTPPLRTGALDVLAQHVLGCACGEPFLSDELYDEVRTAAPYAGLARQDFDDVVDFVASGGYALKTYERFARIRQDKQGRWRVANPKVRQSYRLNVGTIVEEPMLKVRLVRSRSTGSGSTGAIARGGRVLGEIEEYFIEGLTAGDTFVFGGEVVRYEALAEDQVYVSRANDKDPKVPSYMGGKFPLSTYLAERVRRLLDDRRAWNGLPEQVRDWLSLQKDVSRVPGVRELLVETFPRGNKHYLICYPFEGRLAHQTLGMLLTRRLERARARPLGFVANEYAVAIWGLGDASFMVRNGELNLDALFNPDMLGDDLEAWLAESALMKRTFRNCALISGLIERRFTNEDKSRRQVLFSTDLVYDVLRKHQADHVLLRAARADAATGLLDLRRLGGMLARIQGRITHRELDHVSPLAVPVMLEIGRESVYGEAADELLAEAANELVKEAMG